MMVVEHAVLDGLWLSIFPSLFFGEQNFIRQFCHHIVASLFTLGSSSSENEVQGQRRIFASLSVLPSACMMGT
jgi:hypothetical protein